MVDIDSTEGEPGRVLRVPSKDTRIHIGRPDEPTKEDIQRAKVDDLDAAIVAALRAEPMSANQLTKSIRRLRDDVYVAMARLVDIGRWSAAGSCCTWPRRCLECLRQACCLLGFAQPQNPKGRS